MIQETEIALAIGMRIANDPAMPRFKSTDEFAKNSKR
jgi:hypothetical protein